MAALKPPVAYLDHASAPLPLPELPQWYAELSRRYFWNPHGTTLYAEESRRALLSAEERLLSLLGTTPADYRVIWTSGVTESLNLAARCQKETSGTAREFSPFVAEDGHPALVEPFIGKKYEFPVAATYHVNSDTGALCNLAAFRSRHPGTVIILDAAQSFCKHPFSLPACGIQVVALSSLKIGGPASIGALVHSRDLFFAPLFVGGGQQQNARSGTVDLVGVEMFVRTAEKQMAQMESSCQKVTALNRCFWEEFQRLFHGKGNRISPEGGSPYIAMCSFPGYEGAVLCRILAQDFGVLISPSSACTAEKGIRANALRHLDEQTANGALRISFSHQTTMEEIQYLFDSLQKTLKNY